MAFAMSAHEFEFGLDTAAQLTVDGSGKQVDGDQVIRELLAAAPVTRPVR